MACQLLEFETRDIIDMIYKIIIELDARECGANLLYSDLRYKSWSELCEEVIELLELIK